MLCALHELESNCSLSSVLCGAICDVALVRVRVAKVKVRLLWM
jgi:hypothetical protein